MEVGQCSMQPEDAPPDFWQRPLDRAALIDGATLESGVPTRFFQTVDALPPEWGRFRWRVQLNKIASDRAGLPVFRTFYPGVEWNLNHPDYRWFLSARFKWDGGGPQYRDPGLPGAVRVEADTVLFRIAWMPKPAQIGSPDAPPEPDVSRPLYLRSRVDARDRKRISEAVQARQERSAIRKRSNLVITNPDMLHVGILPHHAAWGDLFANLAFVVVDEAHVYRGVFGSHVGNVLRRVRRQGERGGHPAGRPFDRRRRFARWTGARLRRRRARVHRRQARRHRRSQPRCDPRSRMDAAGPRIPPRPQTRRDRWAEPWDRRLLALAAELLRTAGARRLHARQRNLPRVRL